MLAGIAKQKQKTYVTFYNGMLPIIGKDSKLPIDKRYSQTKIHQTAIDRIREINDNKTITGYKITVNGVTSALYNVTIKENNNYVD